MSRLGHALTFTLAALLAAALLATATNAATGNTYYISAHGSDTAAGTTPATAWRNLSRIPASALEPGDTVLLQRGGTYPGQLNISASGTTTDRITLRTYGAGARPILTGGSCLEITGSNVTVSDIQTLDCAWSGIAVGGESVTVTNSRTSGNVTGIHIQSGSYNNRITGNQVVNNREMSVNISVDSMGDDDSGAFGILVNGDNTEIDHNVISGHAAPSSDYGVDGAAVEIYGAIGTRVHHNVAKDNEVFTELGDKRSRDTEYAYNVVTSTLENSEFLVTRGAGSRWGPILNTRVIHNTVRLDGPGSQGVVCHAGCSPDILSLSENVISATWKVGYADAGFDTARNIFWGGEAQFDQGDGDHYIDPQFQSADTHDVSLSQTSPAIDSGTRTSWTTDISGQSVPTDGNRDGISSPDIGALERP